MDDRANRDAMFDIPVMVVGDVMLDRHVHGHVRRISPEAPVPVVSLVGRGPHARRGGQRRRHAGRPGLPGDPGRAGGRRRRGSAAPRGPARQGRRAAGPARGARPADDQQDPHPLRQPAAAPAAGPRRRPRRLRRRRRGPAGRILPLVDEQAAVVLADYEKGVITPAVARAVIDRCRRRGIPCVVDPKKADFAVYARATVVTPNLLEAERAVGRAAAGRRGGRPRRRRDADRAGAGRHADHPRARGDDPLHRRTGSPTSRRRSATWPT